MNPIPQGYKQTEIGVIPEDWEIKSIGKDAVLKARIGWQALTTSEYESTGSYFLVTGTDFDAGEVIWERCCYVSEWRYKQDTNIQLRTDDVLITKDGTIGKVGYVAALYKPSTLNSGVFVIRPKNAAFIPRYLFYVLTSRVFDDFIKRITAGSTITHLYQKDFVNFEFIAPTKEEQTAIATALSDVDALITGLESLIAKKQAIKTATMQQLLTGKTRLPQFAHHPDGTPKGTQQTELGEIPEDWGVVEFGSVLKEFRNGYAFSASGYASTGTPIITMAQIGLSGSFQFDISKVNKWDSLQYDLLKDFWVRDGDLLIAMTDVTPDKNLIGQMTIAKLDGIALLNQRVGLLRLKNEIAYSGYFNFLSCLPVWRAYCKGVASLGVQANIGTSDIRKAKVPLPPIKEQSAIAQVLSDMDEEIQTLQTRLSKTQHIKQGMMQQLLTGKVRLVKPLHGESQHG